jgi:hypothetical protein
MRNVPFAGFTKPFLFWFALTAMYACADHVLAAANNKPEAKSEPGIPQFTYKFRKAEDEIRTSLEKDGIVFHIASKSGIGDAEITLLEGSWPKNITFQFVKSAEYLEYFLVSNGRIKLHGSLRVRPKSVWFYDQNGRNVEDRNKAVYTMMIQYKEEERLMEVILPPNFCSQHTKTLRTEWINAFRR